VAALAGVGATTIKLLKKLQKEAPDQFEAVAQGQITAKKALKGIEPGNEDGAADQQGEGNQAQDKRSGAKSGLDQTGQQPRTEREVAPGDLIYEVEPFRPFVKGSPKIIEWQVCSVDTHSFLCVGNKRLHKVDAFTLDEAKAERIKRLQGEIAGLKEELRGLKAEMKKKPIIVAAKRPGGEGG
jgi:hypothetical protein